MLAGSPGSVRLSFALQQRMRLRSLDDVFRAEYIAALACAAHGDFAEGIRALLIDKRQAAALEPCGAGRGHGRLGAEVLRRTLA